MVSKRSLKLFHEVSKEVPAYKKFLKAHSFNPSSIRRLDDFEQIPVTDKKNYLRPNELSQLVWKKESANPQLLCSTSGSTGEAYYFPRNEQLSWQYSHLIEDFLRQGQKGSTLVLLGFGMGVWIGGVITLRAFEIASSRIQAPVSILPTGYNKVEIFKALKKLSPDFDQTIIVGYPPFVKELIDEAPKEDINLKKLSIRFLFAAEAFTETFRDYLCRKAGVKQPLINTLNIYGSADIGAMAYETPLSILIRRKAVGSKALFKGIFGQIEKTPTLGQYNPDFIEFESVDNEILLTGNAALPLIRYAIGDHGGVVSYDQMHKIFSKHNIDLKLEAKKAGITSTVKKFPFVFVYERADFSVTLHGIIIYPEFVKEALLDPNISSSVTERFTMQTKYDRRHNQYIAIYLELQKGVRPSVRLKVRTERLIKQKLAEKSSEFSEVSKSRHNQRLFKLQFWPNGSPKYFPQGVKQKWVLK